MSGVVALAGNPNCGKTTLFNALTGSAQYVGNWPGVTVEKKEARLEVDGREITLTDLPGVYALTPYSLEEKITREFIEKGAPEAIVNVVDATNLPRNLCLTLQLLATGRPVVVALNLMDEFTKRGGKIDAAKLERALGAPVAAVSAKKRTGFDELFSALNEAFASPGRGRGDALAAGDAYARIARILTDAGYVAPAQDALTRRIDGVALNRYWAYPVFALVMACVFLLPFGGVGAYLSAGMEALLAGAGNLLTAFLRNAGAPDWFLSFARDGVLAGVGGVLSFLPQILLIFLCLSLLEDGGYMARAAILADKPLAKAGLSGRSFIPLLMGFGCTTTAVLAARGVENERDRRMTILLTPFISCGARLPVYALFAGAFFPAQRAALVAGLYLTGLIVMALCAFILRKTLFKAGETPFLMELPPYRLPDPLSVLRRLRQRTRDFLVRAGTIIFAMSVLIWLLRSLSPALRYVSDPAKSLFAAVCALAAPLFAPLGFGTWRPCAALVSGLVAKEAMVSTLGVLHGADVSLANALALDFTPLSALSFLVFVLLYAPCVSAIAVMKRELASRTHLKTALALPFVMAYLLAFLFYRGGRMLGFI